MRRTQFSNRRPRPPRSGAVTVEMALIVPIVVTLIFGVALMLIWAGIIEAFLSQYHEPVIPYSAKIAFGAVELVLLVLFLGKCGSKAKKGK